MYSISIYRSDINSGILMNILNSVLSLKITFCIIFYAFQRVICVFRQGFKLLILRLLISFPLGGELFILKGPGVGNLLHV